MSARARAVALALPFTLAGLGCEGCDPRLQPNGNGAPSGSAATPAPPALRPLRDLVQALPECDIEHRGMIIDAGTEALVGRLGWRTSPLPRPGAGPDEVPAGGITSVEHDGSSWSRLHERRLDVSFTLLESATIFVAARGVGHASKAASVALDEQPLGTLTFGRDQIKVAQTPVTNLPVDAGRHTLTFRFSGRPRNDRDPFAEIDWVRIGISDDDPAIYGALTLRDLVLPAAAIGGVPHQSIALRAPGAVRCPVQVPPGARLRTSVGMLGAGEGELEVRVLRDLRPTETIASYRVTGGDKAGWTEVDASLAPFAGELVSLELRAITGARGGRVLFGDPVIAVSSVAPPPSPPARAVVIVVMNAVEPWELPPWATTPTPHLPALGELALTATVFDRHRAPSTVVPSVVASILTGLPPRAHTLADRGARLPSAQTTLATVARDGSVRTGMFTGVPTTTRAFGFAGSWEKFVEHAPQSGDPATTSIDAAAAWIVDVARASPEGRLFALVHARGAHPPWEVTPKELTAVPPPGYTGMIDPRGAGQVLARVRQKGGALTLNAADRERARALEAIALAGQDRALGALMTALKTNGLWDSTLFIVTGDVASGISDGALFADGGPLREAALHVPLYVHFPAALHGGARVDAPTEAYDLTRTTLAALGLTLPGQLRGRDLGGIASSLGDSGAQPQIATLGDRYATRWGSLVLSGRFDVAPQLCDLGVDPTCAFDRRETMPLATQALFARTMLYERETRPPPNRREPVTIDAETAAQLQVWGAD